MKSFAQILQESKTTYSFNIGVAGELAGEECGPGLVAEDIPPYLSKALMK